MDNNNLVRFLLTFFLGWIGSLIINHTSLKPEGYTSRTGGYIIWGYLTCGIYILVASIATCSSIPPRKETSATRRTNLNALGTRFGGCSFLTNIVEKIGQFAAIGQGDFVYFIKMRKNEKYLFTNTNGCSIIPSQPTPVTIRSPRQSHI